ANNIRFSDKLEYASTHSVNLAPRGEQREPNDLKELLQALICTLTCLKGMHEIKPQPIMHRDVRWPNIIRHYDEYQNFILIDFDYATFSPAVEPLQEFSESDHAPEMLNKKHDFKDALASKTDDDTKRIDQSSVNTTFTKTENSNDTHEQIDLQCDDIPVSDITNNASTSDNAPNSDVSFKDKEIEFLERVRKEQIRNEVRERKREKLIRNNKASAYRDQEPIQKNFTPKIDQNVLEEPINQTQNTISSEIKIPYNKKVEQGLIYELFEFIRDTDPMSLRNLKKIPLNSIFIKQISDIPVDIDLTSGSIPHLAHLFGKAEKTGRKEKLRWYYYSEEYEKRVSNLSSEKNISDQMARTQIYDEMMQYLLGIKREYLRKMTQKARTIYTLFKGIGTDKIEYISYSVDAISSLTGTQIQNIISLYTEKLDAQVSLLESQKLIGVKNSSRAHDQPKSDSEETLSETKVRLSTTPSIPLSHTSNSEDEDGNKNNDINTILSDDEEDVGYYYDLEQYPNLYKDGNSESVDYYGIADETLCPLCKLDHDDDEDIEGRYKIGSYYIKCEQRGIEIEANKTLTPEYLEWHNKFTGLPNVLTDNIRSKLYKRYKKETGFDPWIMSETFESPQIEKDAEKKTLFVPQ
ncbi:19192_t:CDS:2, partial [Racocetra fulgida]